MAGRRFPALDKPASATKNPPAHSKAAAPSARSAAALRDPPALPSDRAGGVSQALHGPNEAGPFTRHHPAGLGRLEPHASPPAEMSSSPMER
jgi:hypothetical protein